MLKGWFLFLAGLPLTCSFPCMAQCSRHAALNQYERGQFIEVASADRSSAFAQFLSEPGCSKPMLDSLVRLGATIDYADERSGYFLVTISRGKLLDTLDIAGVAYAYTRNDSRLYQGDAAEVPQGDRKTQSASPIEIPYPKVTMTIRSDGPYFAASQIGLTELWQKHPEADGRGVRVGVADDGFDLLHPEIGQAKDAQGNLVPKVADIETLTIPDDDSNWVRFGDPFRTKNQSFEAAGRTWKVPKDGTYRFGIFRQDLLLGPEGNPQTRKLKLAVGVLWDEQAGRVWVDTDGDGSFRNQRALGDYGVTHDVGWFGDENGDNDDRIPFGVKIDPAHNAAYIRIAAEHGTYVAGALAGNNWSGGLFGGAAPAAQLIDENITRATLLAAIVRLFARRDVDIVNFSGGIGRGWYTGADEGKEDFEQHVIERATAVYDKPFVAFSAAVGAIHVNDYAGPEMLRRNRQIGPPYKDTINSFVWWSANGMVNNVLAPSANLEAQSRYDPIDITEKDGKRHGFNDRLAPMAPNGYTIGDNNSPAIPIVSGILADLISEARRKHIRYNALRLNNAIFTGTRLLEGIPASQQGYGLVNASQSWHQLARMARADDPNNPELTYFTVSRKEAGKSVEVRGFHADLSAPGKELNGEIWITRHGGYAQGRKYTFALRGNDGTYTLIDHEAILVRGRPVRVRFRAGGASGWHLAFLELRDTLADAVMQDVPFSVRVPDKGTDIAPGVKKYESTIPPLRSEYWYVALDDSVQAVRYVMHIPYTGPEMISTRSFPGADYDTEAQPPGEAVDAAHHVGPIERLESLVTNDDPGNQEIFWENRGQPEYATQYDGPSPDIPIHAELTVSKYGVSIKRAGDTLTITNHLAAVRGRTEVYDATIRTEVLRANGPHAFGELDRQLPAGLFQWRFRVIPRTRLQTPVDVYVLNCSGKNGCYIAAQQEISSTSKTIVIDKPQMGAWRIVVRSREPVSTLVSFSCREALLSGGESNTEVDSDHANASSWTLHLLGKTRNVQYAAFRISGMHGNEDEKEGLLISMTPLDANAP